MGAKFYRLYFTIRPTLEERRISTGAEIHHQNTGTSVSLVPGMTLLMEIKIF
jgi:hypothetical protein